MIKHSNKKASYIFRLLMSVFTLILIILFFFIMSIVSRIQGIDSCDSDHEWHSSAISGNTADERLEEQSLVF